MKLSRLNSVYDFFRPYIIVIDGKKYGKIRNGESLEIELDNGRHSIELHIDWCSSKTIDFEVNDRPDISFECCPWQKGKVLALSLAKLTTKRNEYIQLYQI